MKVFSAFLGQLRSTSSKFLTSLPIRNPSTRWITQYPPFRSSIRTSIFKVNPFWLQLGYFTCISLLGYLALSISKPRTGTFGPTYTELDIFFTAVSACTVSSMSTMEMEVFSNYQLIVLTILMLLGGEVFTSLLELLIERSEYHYKISSNPALTTNGQVQLVLVDKDYNDPEKNTGEISPSDHQVHDHENLKYNSIRILSNVVVAYLLVVHFTGSGLIALYTTLVASAKQVLETKGLRVLTFSVLLTTSTFANSGYIPTNENMVVFRKNSGLLLLLMPLVLMGNTLYAPCLRFLIWVLKKTTKRDEYRYILNNYKEIGSSHMLSGLRCYLLVGTVLVLVLVQLSVFISFEWSSAAMDGMDSYQKLVASLFQVVNSRHAGESVVDLSIISPAILVLFVVMMYLPPYTLFMPVKEQDDQFADERKTKGKTSSVVESLLFSQLTYLVISVILICITENDKLKNDPLNFNVLFIVIEVFSAYGNVGFSTGYSCQRQLKPEIPCHNFCYGFVGKWSREGKVILILVMFFGRLKRFSMKTGKAWKLS